MNIFVVVFALLVSLGGTFGWNIFRIKSDFTEEIIDKNKEKHEENKESVLALINHINKKAWANNKVLQHVFPGEYTGEDGIAPPFHQFRHVRKRRAAYHNYLWPKNVAKGVVEIPFQLRTIKNSVIEAMETIKEAFEERTCIRFIPWTPEHEHYVNITDADGCFTQIGYVYGTGVEQMMNLGPRCTTRGLSIHEAMHILGFDHTMVRRDRDLYIEINLDNVRPDYERNFAMHDYGTATVLGIPFRFDSIMNYGWNDFAKDYSKPTIINIHNRSERFVKALDWSEHDIEQINRLYECDDYYNTEMK